MLETTEDEWLRMDRDIVELCKNGSTTPLSNRRFYIGNDGLTYWELKQTTSGLVGQPTTYTTATHRISRNLSKGKFLIQHKDGQVVAYGWEDKGGKNITCSCWTSLKLAGW
jgi:hypothetical protein